MQAIILAAGMGKRLGRFTANNTKCMVRVNNQSLIERAIDSLLAANISRIVIVAGYKAEELMAYVGACFPRAPIEYVINPIYDITNNIQSLWLAKGHLQADDTILLESDLIFDPSLISDLVKSPEKSLAVVSKFEPWMDGTVTLLDGDSNVVSVIDKKQFSWSEVDTYYKTVNIYKFSREFSNKYYVPFLNAYLESYGTNQYYEQVLKILAYMENTGLKGMRVSGRLWYEIDDVNDLHIAETLFGDRSNRLELIQKRFGGYWRYPGLLDYCYLVNPFFPPRRMWEELKSGLQDVVSCYPSGMTVQSTLAAKIFNVPSEMIVVGNGATELIASLFRCTNGKVGVIDPCFNEYPARAGADRVVRFDSSKNDYIYSADTVIPCWEGQVEWAILVNPDNPSGHFLSRDEVVHFIERCEGARIRPIIDESFADFVDPQEKYSLFDESFMSEHPTLVLVKSLSKSHGVPGLRLGCLASADVSLISRIKQDVAIWNINSVGEYFLQIVDKYKKDYEVACERVARERARLAAELRHLAGDVHVYPSQANYLMCRLDGNITAKELAESLFESESILIKDLTGKHGFKSDRYIRIAIRTELENDRLLAGVKKLKQLDGVLSVSG